MAAEASARVAAAEYAKAAAVEAAAGAQAAADAAVAAAAVKLEAAQQVATLCVLVDYLYADCRLVAALCANIVARTTGCRHDTIMTPSWHRHDTIMTPSCQQAAAESAAAKAAATAKLASELEQAEQALTLSPTDSEQARCADSQCN